MISRLFVAAAACAGFSAPAVDAKKIFWVPFPGSVSHHMLAAKVGQELAARGHEFIVINTDYDGKQFGKDGKVNTDGITELLYPHPLTVDEMTAWLDEIAVLDPFAGTQRMVDMVYAGCDTMLQDESIISQIKDADVIIVDAAVMCGSVVRDVLKTPIRVDFLPITFYDPFYIPRLGSANEYSYVPQMGSKLTPNMDFGQRVANTIVGTVDKIVEAMIADPAANKLRAKYGLKGTHKEAMADTGMMITQNTWITEFPRAIPPAVKLVGPILASPAKPIENAELAAFIERADKVVIVSFGSQARVTQAIVDKLAEAFGKLKGLHVIWKTPGMEPATVPDNVMTTKWFPQNDLLGQGKVVAFFSHGGLNSVSEAAYHGVPVVGFPLFGDQWDNIARLEYQGMAKNINADDFTVEGVVEVVEEVANTPSYKTNAAKVATIIHDTPKRPVELAADWVEYAIRHDGALFQKVPGLDQSWIVSSGWDVTIFFLVVAAIFWKVLKFAAGLCRGKPSTSDNAKKAN